MEVKTLLEIKDEVKRFSQRLDAAIKRSKENKGYISSYDKSLTGVGDINGTKESGAVKRAALDLKMELTKITNQ